jgi:hypothetical protein
MRRLRSGLTYANVVSTVCLFILLGGGAYAATQLPRNSVGSAQIKRGAVTSSEVKNRSLLARDFKRGQLPRGRRGATGPAGLPGRPGPAGAPGSYFNAVLRVQSTGDIDPPSSRFLGGAGAERLDEGRYCVVGFVQAPDTDVVGPPRNAIVTPEDEDRAASVKTTPQSSPDCRSGTLVTLTNTLDGTREDGAFYILLSN